MDPRPDIHCFVGIEGFCGVLIPEDVHVILPTVQHLGRLIISSTESRLFGLIHGSLSKASFCKNYDTRMEVQVLFRKKFG